MSEKPEGRPEERRRTGPLGDDAESTETRREPSGDSGAGTTRRVPEGRAGGRTEEWEGPARETERASRSPFGGADDKETRVIRTPPAGPGGAQSAASYPRSYFEAVEEREDRLRDIYGGVDWFASFLGFVFAAVVGAFLSVVAGLVLAPLGFSLALGGELGATAITGLALVAILIFLTYFCGGYVAGRLARFDGGRNGAVLLLWTVAAALLVALAGGIFGGFLPPALTAGIGSLVQGGVLAAAGNLSQLGAAGLAVAAGAILVALLGGFLGGRLGSRYHAEIDHTT